MVGVAEGHLLTLVCIAMMAGKRVLTFVTGNPRKLEEVSSILLSLSLTHILQVVAILGDNTPWRLISNDVDCKCIY